jgi:predicted  nucleic acid-binding Zn-ribbon protein
MKRLNSIGLALSLLVISSTVSAISLPSMKDLEKAVKSGENMAKKAPGHIKNLQNTGAQLMALQKAMTQSGISAGEKLAKAIEGANKLSAALNDDLKPMLNMSKDIIGVIKPAQKTFNDLEAQFENMAKFSKELSEALNQLHGVTKLLDGSKPAPTPAAQ